MDRNKHINLENVFDGMSPPARVAWIETYQHCDNTAGNGVATREGGVDRNTLGIRCIGETAGRHPRGWRG